MNERVVLSLGSNSGDSRAILRRAVDELATFLGDIRVSSLYLTKPQDVTEQPDFCNIAVSGCFGESPVSLLERIHRIETAYGRDRDRETPKGPRTLDIDIALFGERSVNMSALVIPHERMHLRQFVLIPLLELHPDSADPVTGESYLAKLQRLPDQGVKKAGALYGN